MALKALIPVSHLPHDADSDTLDSSGNLVPGFGKPVAVMVYSISPRTQEQTTSWATDEVADLDVFMPKTVVSLKDRFVVDGDTFEVVGVSDWTKGFHGWKPGIVVELKRAE